MCTFPLPSVHPKAPVVLPVADKLVYSPHVYGPDVHKQPYFADPQVGGVLMMVVGAATVAVG
jgi:hypothetical protein